jgi:hypothetical protein
MRICASEVFAFCNLEPCPHCDPLCAAGLVRSLDV